VFPYHDENETERSAYAAATLIAVSVLAWVFIQGGGARVPLASSVCRLGLVPGALTGALPPGAHFPVDENLFCVIDPDRQLTNVVASMFLHGSWMHLLGNMWFLWLFGNNVEDAMTLPRLVLFYLLCGLGAALLQVAMSPGRRSQWLARRAQSAA
jgi:membrane associated rhomboid family serine protease